MKSFLYFLFFSNMRYSIIDLENWNLTSSLNNVFDEKYTLEICCYDDYFRG